MAPRDILLAIVVPVIWGFGFTVAKAGLDAFPPMLLVALRYTITALALVWFVPVPRTILSRLAGIAFVGATLQFGLTFYGLKGLDAATTVLVVQTEVPFLALVAAVLLKERIGPRRLVGMAVAFAGVVLIAGAPKLSGNLGYVLLVLGGAFTWALAQVMIRRFAPGAGGMTLVAWIAVMAAPQMFVVSLLIEHGQLAAVVAADWRSWGVILYLGLVMTALGYGLWYQLLGRSEVNQAGPFLLLLPVTTVVTGIVLLGERPTLPILLGGAVVIAGLVIMTVPRWRWWRPRSAPTPPV